MTCEVSLISTLVRKCTTVASLKPARQLHARILTAMNAVSHIPTPYIYNNVLSMYGKCGSLRDAEKVFDEMPHRNIVSYNALISAYSRSPGENSVAVTRLIAGMDSDCLSPNGSTFTSLFHALEDLLIGALLHCRAVKLGFSSDKKVQTSLIGMYSNSGDITAAKKVFRWLSEKDAAAWNSIMIGNSKNGDSNAAISAFREMLRSETCSPNESTYSMALKLIGKSSRLQIGKQIHTQIVTNPETRPDSGLMNSLIDMYFNCDNSKSALSLFHTSHQIRDLGTWNSVISNMNSDESMQLFTTLKSVSVNLNPDEYTFAGVISSSSKNRKPLHGLAIRSGFAETVYVGSALVKIYFENGESREAEKVFESVERKDWVLWTEMIAGFSDGNSMGFLREMCRQRGSGAGVDGYALSAAVGACAEVAMLRQGETVHCRAVKTGFEGEMSVCGSLVDMYAKNGLLLAAGELFSGAVRPDLKCWNAMLSGYGRHGMAREAMEMFEEIERQGLEADEITFLSLLSACNHKGLVEQGKWVWARMVWAGLDPGPKHYCCLVSLLSRAGLMDEAEGVIVNSPPSFGDKDVIELWRTLLSSCVVSKNLSLGIKAANRVLSLDEEDKATRVLLSNLYAGSGEWDGVSCVRKNINSSGFDKYMGLSWLEVQNAKFQSEEEFRLEHKIHY